MAFDLIGLNPVSSSGLAARVNVWKWNEFLDLLVYCDIMSENEVLNLRFNDNISFNAEQSKKIANKLKESLGTNFLNFEIFLKYLRSDEESKKYKKNSGYKDQCCQILNITDIKYILFFLENCGGFKLG